MICPVCLSVHTIALYNTPPLPLSIMSVTGNPEESVNDPRASMSIRACLCCSHIYNGSFDPDFVSYSHGGCKMFNNGSIWQEHIKSLQAYINSKSFTQVVEIGAGDGSFLSGITTKDKFAYEPSTESALCESAGLSVIRDYFQPTHVKLHPEGTLYVMRHVMEHLTRPSAFVETMTRAACGNIDMIVEVPNIVNALRDKRIEDWVYEHAHHFTPTSLKRLFIRNGWRINRCETVYNNEVVVLHAEHRPTAADKAISGYIEDFRDIRKSLSDAANELRMLSETKSVAFWGGTGKSTMSIHQLGSEAKFRVVDSDVLKVGLCVPGLAVTIEHANSLIDNPVDVIVISTSWRAADILGEIQRKGIRYEKILMYKRGKLVEVSSGQ